MVVKTKLADISLISRVRTRRNKSYKHSQNSKKTTRRATSAIWRIFAEHVFSVAVLAQSVERVDCRAGGRGFDSWGRTNTQGLKITEK